MERDERAGARAVLGRVGLDAGRVQDDASGAKPVELGLAPARMNIVRGEQRVVGARRHDPHRDPVRRVGAGEGIDDVEVALAEVSRQPSRAGARSCSGSSGWLTLPHQIRSSDARLADDELVFGERPVCLPVSTTSGAALGEHAVAARARRA